MGFLDRQLEGLSPGQLKGEVITVDRVVGSIDQFDPEIDHWISGKRPASRRVTNPLLNRRTPLLWNCPTKDSVLELKTGPARQWLKDAFAVSKLSTSTGLLLMASLHLGPGADRLPVGHLRLMEHHFDVVPMLQLRDHRLDVLLACSTQLELPGLIVTIIV